MTNSLKPDGETPAANASDAPPAHIWKRKEPDAPVAPADFIPFRDKPIGEVLLEEWYITPDQLSQALNEQRISNAQLGEILTGKGWVTEQVFAKAMKDVGRRLKIGEVLLNEKVITREQLDQGLAAQKLSWGKPFGEVLVECGLAEEQSILMAVSRQLGIQYLDISRDDFAAIDPEMKDVLKRVPKSLWTETKSLPIFYIESLQAKASPKDGEAKTAHLSIVMADPLNKDFIDRIEKETWAEVSAYVCNSATIKKGYDYLFGSKISTAPSGMDALEASKHVRYLNKLMFLAVLRGASDIHVEPCDGEVTVRMRINGKLRKVDRFATDNLRGFLNVVKHASKLDITKLHLPQDGSFMRALGGHIVDIRVSTMPTIYGEKLVLCMLLQDMSRKSLYDSNLPPRIERQLVSVMNKKNGVILVTWPTGSGKTTMLHRAIQHVAWEGTNIVTLEDPVEYRAGEFVNQSAINEARGFTYPVAIRSVLRQDPDVILVGEIRDTETAQIATQAALTGHLVLSTLHTEDALWSIVRLIQLGVAEWLISSTVVTVLNQRLIRRLCDCAEDMPIFPGREYFRGMDIDDHVVDELERDWSKYKIKSPCGCKKCDGEGYRSLQVIVEQLTLTSMVRDMIREGKPYREVIEFIREKHFMNMIFEEGVRQVLLGNTSFHELRDLPRGDYVMKTPGEIMRDATETAETRRIDLPNVPRAFIVPQVQEKVDGALSGVWMANIAKPMPHSAPVVPAASPEAPAKISEMPLSDASVDRILSNAKIRRQLIKRLLDMDASGESA